MYYFTIGAIFKNEAAILSEWLNHYIYHGVEKFYLINDNSSDNFMEILQPYIDNDLVVLYNAKEPLYQYRQAFLYDEYLLPVIQRREVQWMAILDLDEFLYSPHEKEIPKILKKYEHIGQIQLFMIDYGSNGHLLQPKNIVKSFTKRSRMHPFMNTKNIINSNFYTVLLGLHESHVYGPRINLSILDFAKQPEDPSNNELLVNHYKIQSVEFWQNVKMTRGDADCYLVRDMELFKKWDINDIEDARLAVQNADITAPNLDINNTYKGQLPENTYHKYCSNLTNGSRYGTDGILTELLNKINIDNKYFYQYSGDDLHCLPCMYKMYSGIVHSDFHLQTGYPYMRVQTDNINTLPKTDKNYAVLSCKLSLWKSFSNSGYHTADPKIVLVSMETARLNDFLDCVRCLLSKRYTPVAVCNNTVIAVLSMDVKKLGDFPHSIGYTETDFLHLYTNLYYENGKWFYKTELEDDMCVRNFYIKYSRMPKEDETLLLDEHKRKNRSLIWKPIVNF